MTRWTDRERGIVREGYEKGTPVKEISKLLPGRSLRSITAKAQYEGLSFPGHPKYLWISKSYRNTLQPTSKQFQIILGSMLGDGHIYTVGSFREPHSSKQRDYLTWKMRQLGSLFTDKREKWPGLEPKPRRRGQYYISTRCFSFLKAWRRAWYPNGKKIVPPIFLNKLEPLGLAVWFMDDGSCHKDRLGCNYFLLSSQSFTKKENEILMEFLQKRFDIRAEVKVYNGYPQLYIARLYNRARNFQKIIEPFIHPSMYYKLNPAWYFKEDLENYQ